MMLGARTGAWSPIGTPLPYDAEVEWLQGDGVAYIELDDRYFGYFKRAGISKGTSNTDEYFSGGFSGRHIHAFGSRAGSVIICEQYRTKYEASYVADGFEIYDLVADGTNFVISKDGVELTSTPCTVRVPNAYTGKKLLLFASNPFSNTPTVTTSIFTGRCSYFKVEDDNSLILDLISVRKGSVGYMYDRVSGKLYGNAAETGAFIIGPDKTT